MPTMGAISAGMRRLAVRLLAVSLVALVLVGGCTGVRFSRLRPGMTKEEVKTLFGEPTGTTRERVGPDDIREVWVYHIPRVLDRDTPLYPALHFVVFKNEKALGWDLPDPYRPDLK